MTAKLRGLPPAPRVLVAVTADIIASAVEADSGHCMIADALKASCPFASLPSADLATVRFSDLTKNLRYVYLAPRRVQEALLAFDQGIKPEPFTFELRAGQTTRSQRRVAVDPHESPLEDGRPRPRRRAKLVSTSDGAIPSVRGGKPPPMGALAGGAIGAVAASRRRSFGLRSMDRYVSLRAARAVLAEHGETEEATS